MRLSTPLLPRQGSNAVAPLPPTVARIVRDALARRPHGASVVVFDVDGVEVREREDLVQHYRRAGVRELVTKLRRAVVPRDHVLCLVDLEVGTRVIAVPLDDLTALADLVEVSS